MWNRISSWMSNPVWIILIGAIVILIALHSVMPGIYYAALLTSVALAGVGYGGWWWYKNRRAGRQGEELSGLIQGENATAPAISQVSREDADLLKSRINDAVKTISRSRLGDRTGRAALYELPWYMVIGSPGAGKSTAITHSGLNFPFADKKNLAVQGVGGTRNCDWFFSTEGILIDTAGRYSTYQTDHQEWLEFLRLLKKSRPLSPINGVVLTVSVMDLIDVPAEKVTELGKHLRERVQDITEHLEIYVPVYLMFTKLDLMSGFRDFFGELDPEEAKQVWGATLPYEPQTQGDQSAVTMFDTEFEALYEGLKDLSMTQMALRHHHTLSPALMTFPMEFQSLRPMLRLLVNTLFEDNPFQFKPVLRGFYFTSAVQEGQVASALVTEMARKYHLAPPEGGLQGGTGAQKSYFLRDLFSKVVLKDRYLVRQQINRDNRTQRNAVFVGLFAVFGIALGLWTWSYLNNQEMLRRVQADLVEVQKIQSGGQGDLASQMKALEILQDRIVQLETYRKHRPLGVSMGLYQGNQLLSQLRSEYFNGIRQVMLGPVHQNIERYLGEVNANARNMQPTVQPVAAGAAPTAAAQYTEPSPTNVEDAYNALKAYLMMADRSHIESSHMNDQVTRFWRSWLDTNRGNMPQSDMIRSAEKLLTFALSNVNAKDFPMTEADLALVDQTRETLRNVVRGTPARDRVLAEIKMRANARFPAVTVAGIVGDEGRKTISGSYIVPGAYTRQAWDKYVNEEINRAANNPVKSVDWVLNSTAQDDLTLTGSPEQIRRNLVARYKQDYATEWTKFIGGVHVEPAGGFDQQVNQLNQLAGKESPLREVLTTISAQTAWDNPSMLNDPALGEARGRFIDWLKSFVLRGSPSGVNVNVNMNSSSLSALEKRYGTLGKVFFPMHELVRTRSENQNRALLDDYMNRLGAIRGRVNQIKTAGNPGPGSLEFLINTQNDTGGTSELNAAVKLIDEQMVTQGSPELKAALRSLLISPVTQTFTTIQAVAQDEINKVWQIQVYKPFQDTLAGKYPFNPSGSVEATAAETGRFFGDSGQVRGFFDKNLAPLVNRYGDELTPKTWLNMGIQLDPQFAADFARYAAGSGGAAAAAGAAAAPPGTSQTTFQIMPLPSPNAAEYTITLDGQVLHYQPGSQNWMTFVWPNQTSQPGATIQVMGADGKSSTIFDAPGSYGIEKFIANAARKPLSSGVFEMSWTKDGITVPVQFRLVSGSAGAGSHAGGGERSLKGLTLPARVVMGRLASTAAAPAIAGTVAPAVPPKPVAATVAGAS